MTRSAQRSVSVQFGRFIAISPGRFWRLPLAARAGPAIVLDRIPATLYLAGVTMLSLSWRCCSASSPRCGPLALGRIVTVVSLGGVSTAGLLGRLMLILFFAVQLGWLPTSGYGGLQYVILPAIGWRCARWADQPGRPQRDDQRCRSSTWSPHAPRDSRAHVVFSHAL